MPGVLEDLGQLRCVLQVDDRFHPRLFGVGPDPLRLCAFPQNQLEGGDQKFVIDFANTGYIDSSGLGVLVSLSKKIREQGGELRLSSLNEDLRTLFELTKLDSLFQLADSRAAALRDF